MKNPKPINSPIIQDDWSLLQYMVNDINDVKEIYRPGPYWRNKTKNAVNEIKKFGIGNFRGCENGIATSYGDNAVIDLLTSYNYGTRSIVRKIYRNFYPFNKVFESQVRLTKQYCEEAIFFRTQYFKTLDRVRYLLSSYNIPHDTVRGGCISYGVFEGKKISHYYLQLLDTLDHVAQSMDIKNKRSFFEIGGGFGVNVHLLLKLFPNTKKVIYLDIAPNLYVGTQYLKSFFAESVIDYKKTRLMEKISFSENDKLEIICITPAQIERVDSEIDCFHNASSFVEMPADVVKNYAINIERILSKDKGVISLVSYDQFDRNSLDPDSLIKHFKRPFKKQMVPNLSPRRFDYHFISG